MLKTKIKQIFTTQFLQKIILGAVVFAFGISLGVFSGSLFQASIIEEDVADIQREDLRELFPNLDNFREITLTVISDDEIRVDFFASSKLGDSLHPYSYFLKKSANGYVVIAENIDFIYEPEAVTLDIQPLK